MKTDKFQQKLLKKLRNGEKYAYEDASLYTILLDLCEGNGVLKKYHQDHSRKAEQLLEG